MATLASVLNVIQGGTSSLIGTGQQASTFDWSRIKVIEFSRVGYAYTDDPILTKVQQAQQKELIWIVAGMDTCKLVPVEPKIFTSDGSGDETVTGELPYKYELTFVKKGINFWKALRKFNSNGMYNVAFYDVEGNKVYTQTKGGVVKGFGTNMIFTGQYKGEEGNNPAEIKMTIQLSDFSEMERMAWVDADSVDYSTNDLNGYNDIILTPTTFVAGATSIVVKATLADRKTFAAGLALTDFSITKNGAAVTPSAVALDPVAMTYTFTVPAATTGTYTFATTNTFSTGVVLQAVTGLLFKAIPASVTV